MPDALPSTDCERLDGLRAGTIVPLIGPLTEATLHGLGEFDGEERGISIVGHFVGLIGGEVGQLGTAGLRVPMLIRRKAVIARLAAVFGDKIVAREPA